MPTLTEPDLRQLESHGISREEAERQLALLASPPPAPKLVRPCKVGDGIRSLEPERQDLLAERYEEARAAGRAMKLVPASGAATRMFRSLSPWVAYAGNPVAAAKEMGRRAVAGDPEAGDPIRFLSELPRFPFYDELARRVKATGQDLEALRAGGEVGAVLHALLSPAHLDYEARPKALIPFHRGPRGACTPFEEQLVEAAGYVADDSGLVPIHFTVPREARDDLESLAERIRPQLEAELGVRFELSFSIQSPATDTLAVDLGRDRSPGETAAPPFRLESGALLLRPGGHGALLGNLQAIADGGGDLVFVKNIDNVQPDLLKPEAVRWKRVLGGYLADLRRQAFELIAELEAGVDGALEGATAFLVERLGFQLPASWEELTEDERRRRFVERLDRPLRVAGMVVNRGEPGGGPFWVRGDDGSLSAQIVERAQIDPDDSEQVAIFESSTHFNPVDLVCSLRDRENRPYDLSRYVDERAVFIARKSHEGRPLLALERPGLWNGAMGGWNSAFVEVPEATFSPVKTVFDLLRKEHQGG